MIKAIISTFLNWYKFLSGDYNIKEVSPEGELNKNKVAGFEYETYFITIKENEPEFTFVNSLNNAGGKEQPSEKVLGGITKFLFLEKDSHRILVFANTKSHSDTGHTKGIDSIFKHLDKGLFDTYKIIGAGDLRNNVITGWISYGYNVITTSDNAKIILKHSPESFIKNYAKFNDLP